MSDAQTKPTKQDKTKKRPLKNEHALRTMNFLHSAAHQAPTISTATNMNTSLVTLKEKHTSRLTPDLKRSMCSKCKVVLVPGNTARIRVRSKAGNQFRVITCVVCGLSKRYLLREKELQIERCPLFENT
ncbi:ribonuclease P protein subunit p21-like [Bolinopsis microptera]|uniref:ribonuclease P protein subunit p21-like n=1 Tax=Bolinopsis microptera TaxID=2820187 RepID=UPI003079F19E